MEETTEVLIIGGGATGTGVLRDLAMRGVAAVLVEKGDLGYGTSSRFHGLLHSGGRYAVNDPESARECIQENLILKRIAPTCIEDTGGMFVQLQGDDPDYARKWVHGCQQAGIPVKEISREEALKMEPGLSPALHRAFLVPDAAVDGFRLLWANINSARRYGGRVYTYTRVERILLEQGRVTGAEVLDLRKQELRRINCRMIVNTTGAWAGEVAAMAGCRLNIVPDKGTLLVFNHRLTSRVVNRLRRPSDGDIFVPHGTVCILGTTSVPVDGPEYLESTPEEIARLMDLGREMIPNLDECRLLRSFAGVRPLYRGSGPQKGHQDGRGVARQFALIDHGEEGARGLISLVGGKLTTFRLMAEKACDRICWELGNNRPCCTAVEPLLTGVTREQRGRLQRCLSKPAGFKAAERLDRNEADRLLQLLQEHPWKGQMVCECEQVSLAEIQLRLEQREGLSLNDLRCRTRLGMGTCQGTICTARALGQLYEGGFIDLQQVRELLQNFLDERWKGNRAVLLGDQLREAVYTRSLYLSLFNLGEDVDRYEL